MLRIALATLRTRWTGFVGSFVALALGAGLLAVMGLALASSLHAPERKPERFAAAPVLVKGADTLRVATPAGDRVRKLSRPRAVPDEVKARLSRLGRVVEDRAFGVRVRGGPPDLVGHPWPTAAFTPYHLTEGRAPRAGDEVAVSDGWSADGGPVRPGERLRTARGAVRVVGVVGGRGFENAVFYTGRRAAQLSPESPQLVVDTDDAAAVRAVVRDGGAGAHVLTGDARRLADADPDRDREALTAMNAMFGTAGGVSAFVSVFVVAATFAFAVAQRRREFGLLRMAGATPAQVRRTVLCEALVVGALASATGCLLGAQGAPELAAWAVDREPGAALVPDRRPHLAVPPGLLDRAAGGPGRCGGGLLPCRAHGSRRGTAGVRRGQPCPAAAPPPVRRCPAAHGGGRPGRVTGDRSE